MATFIIILMPFFHLKILVIIDQLQHLLVAGCGFFFTAAGFVVLGVETDADPVVSGFCACFLSATTSLAPLLAFVVVCCR